MNTMAILALINCVVTHNTKFHADDVFGVALMRLLKPGVEVIRTTNPKVLQDIKPAVEAGTTLIFDLGCQFGMSKFDHHQLDCKRRPLADGVVRNANTGEEEPIKYCGFGLLWKEFGSVLCPSEKAWKKVDRNLVIPIDKTDNGQEDNTLSSVIGKFNPTWKEGREAEEAAFWQAETFAESIIKRYVDDANAAVEAEEYVLNSRKLDDGQILIMDAYRPWTEFVSNEMPAVKWVLFPASRNPGRWNIQKVPVSPDSKEGRCRFPAEWCGNPPVEMGMTFCHIGNWLAEADNLEHAINIARVAIERFNG